jgi:hypothetical protein
VRHRGKDFDHTILEILRWPSQQMKLKARLVLDL